MEHPDIKENIIYSFRFGSKVYGSDTDKSDDDYMVVVDSDEELKYGLHDDKKNIHVYSDRTFRRLIKEHDIAVIECLFSNDTHYKFELDIKQLRHSISAVVFNSFSKCRKKLKEGDEYDPYIAKKSLFHSLRILDFGIQIAEHGRILDFSSMNHHLDDIMSIDSNDFNVFRKKYEPIGKAMKKRFKKIAPLEKDIRKNKNGW